MTKEEFVEELQDVLQTDAELKAETVLSDLDEWDSLAMMATMAFMDRKFGVKVGPAEVKTYKTVAELMAKAGL